MDSHKTVLVIGLGNIYRKDDGAGIIAAEKIQAMDIEKVKVTTSIADNAALIESWANADFTFIIDAASSGAKPGTVFRFDAFTERIPEGLFANLSTHSLNLTQAFELGKVLGKLPQSLIVFGIEGIAFNHGEGLSLEVEKATIKISDQIKCEIEEFVGIHKG